MGFVEGMALLGFFAMLGWIVVEIAWRNPGPSREIIWDVDAFGRKPAPAENSRPAETLLEATGAPAPTAAEPGAISDGARGREHAT
jgi:hypothetical protein